MADKSENFFLLPVVVEQGVLQISGTAHYNYALCTIEITAQDESGRTVINHVDGCYEQRPVQLERVDVCTVRDIGGNLYVARRDVKEIRRTVHYYDHEIGRTVASWLAEQTETRWHQAEERGLVDDEWVSNPDSAWYRG